MSYAAWMTFANEKPATNSLRFETRHEATQYALDLFSRWTMPTGYEVRESEDAVTHRWSETEGLVRIEAEVSHDTP